MKRSPLPLRSLPPAPRNPSSSRAPVISEFGTTRPVGWNCTISMSLRGAPTCSASAMPSAALSAEQAMTLYMVGPPPMARRVARLRTAVKPPRRMSSEEAAVTALQLHHQPRRLGDEPPHQLLVVDPSPAYHRVEKVGVDGVGLREHGVVAALDHAGAARAPEQSLHHQGHRKVG